MNDAETIVAAAIMVNGAVCFVPRPGRHGDVIQRIHEAGADPMRSQQGFVTSAGRFINRHEAKDIARIAGQIKKGHGKFPELYSEDVW